MNMFTVSVVLATYNGEFFIEKQLDSIRNQSLKPDEVLIFDDGSSDSTIILIKEYIEKYDLFDTWKLMVNEVNMGWRNNFYHAFHCATGDYVFSCDQDDVWELEKIEKMVNVMNSNTQIKLLCCNVLPFTEDGTSIITDDYTDIGTENVEKMIFTNRWYLCVRPGCTYCFRNSLIGDLDRIWFDGLEHDYGLWASSITTDGLYILNEKLVRFRRHNGNNSPQNKKNRKNRLKVIGHSMDLCDALIKNQEELDITRDKYNIIQSTKNYLSDRYKAIESKNPLRLLFLIRHYSYYSKLKSWLGDFISAYSNEQ